jgi:iron complex outermembrane receptor protein
MKNPLLRSYSAAALSGLCLFLPLYSQLPAANKTALPDFSNLTLLELSAVKVTSVSGSQQNLSQAAAAVFVIDREEIHRSGMTTVPDLLRLVPGMTVARLDGSKWAVASRGFNARFSNKLLVLIDGRSVYSPIFSGVNWDVGMPPLEDIDRIEVIRGPGASVWGANAVSGVVNIITKSSADSSGGSVTAGGGTSERTFGQIRYSGKAGDSITYRGYLSGADVAGSPTGSGHTAYDAWSDVQGGFRIDGSTRNSEWQLEGNLFRNQRQEIGDFPSAQAGYATVLTKNDFTGLSSDLGFEWRRRLTDTSDLRIRTSYDSINRPEQGIPVAQTRTADFEIQYHFTLAKHHEVSLGLGDHVISDQTTGTETIAFNPPDLSYQVGSAFVQDEIHLKNDRLLLTFGAKLEHSLFAGWQLQPTARALWALNKHHSVWAAVSQASRTPTLYEQDVTAELQSAPPSAATGGLPVVVTLVGSRQFQPEILRDYEIGYRAQPSKRFSIDIAGVYDNYLHLRTEDQLPPVLAGGVQPYLQFPVTFTNRLKAQAFGGEVSTVYHPVSRWKLGASYGYLDVKSQYVPGTPATTFDSSRNATPRNQWKVQSYLNLSKTVQFDSFLFSASSVASPIYPFGSLILPPHNRVDVRLGWRVTPRFEVSLSGQDLLSPRHIELTPEALTPPGYAVRGYYLKTSWHF